MRSHSHRSMKRLIDDGGSALPRLGHTPRGAKKIEIRPASSSIPSDWYDEKSCSVTTHERNSTVQAATLTLGHTFTTTRTEHTIPSATTAVSARSLVPSHKTLGTYHSRLTPGTTADTRPRYSATGRMPRAPISP